MIRKRIHNEKSQTYIPGRILIMAGIFSIISIGALSITSQVWAEVGSIQTSCVNNQPCQTVTCGEGQPCTASTTPNTDFDMDEAESIPQPLEGKGTIQQPLEDTDPGTTDAYNINDPEDRQDAMEDAEYD